MGVEIIVTEIDDYDSNDDGTTIYLRKNLKLSRECDLYTKKLHLDICKKGSNGKAVIGELSGHFFNLSLLDKDNKSDKVIVLLRHYNQETFDICKSLVSETMCFKRKSKNIYHVDRFYIYPQYRGGGIGRYALKTFIGNISLFLQGDKDIRYVGLYPDPITNDKKFDSIIDMDKSKREMAVKRLKRFYASLGFTEMKSKPEYMYLDLMGKNLHNGKMYHHVNHG